MLRNSHFPPARATWRVLQAAAISASVAVSLVTAGVGVAVADTGSPAARALATPSVPTTGLTSDLQRPARGTVLGSQRYAYPAGAVFVNPSSGNDAAAGTLAAPVRTVAKALTKAPSGGTVVLRAGTYRESIVISRSVTVQNYPGEVAWFDGSTHLGSWTKSGTTWVRTGWTAEFSRTMGGDAAYRNRFLQPEFPVAHYPDQLFVDGMRQRQVGALSQVVPGTFYVDYASDRIHMGSDPTGRYVQASDLAQAIRVQSQHVTLRGFGVRRYATPWEMRGAIQMDFANGTFEHLVIKDNATIGIALSNPGKTVKNLQVEFNGVLGVGGHKVNGMVLSDSVVQKNNAERFKFAPVAGGVKITGTNQVTVRNNRIADTWDANGLWFDAFTSNFFVVNNELVGNGRGQFEAEQSTTGVVANNVATGGRAGIRIYNTDNVSVFNNLLGGHTHFGLQMSQDARWKTQALPGFTLRTYNVLMGNNVLGCGGYFQFYALDGETNIPADRMVLTLRGNLFSKRMITADPTMVGWGQADNKTLVRYESPSALAAAKNSSWVNTQTTGCTPLNQMGAAITAAATNALPLPANVAAAIGTSAGRKVVGLI